jgi:hypothetical protein
MRRLHAEGAELERQLMRVGVRKKTEVGSGKLQDLLRLISPDVSRDDWLRVGNYL